jgi:MinD-like ATPase involved in chromosome partitioning or flagellar assembly
VSPGLVDLEGGLAVDVVDVSPPVVARLQATFGWPVARSAGRERELDEQLSVAAARVTRTNVVAVVGPQGGAGKTRVTYLVGAALAQLAGLNVIACDLDCDYGALADLTPAATRKRRVSGVWPDRSGPLALPKLRAFLSATPSRMLVLEGPGGDADGADLDGMLELLGNADVVLLDCAAGVERDRASWAMARADQVVVVARPEVSGARNAAAAVSRALCGTSAACLLVVNRVRRRHDIAPVWTAFAAVEALREMGTIPESESLARALEATSYELARMPGWVRLAVKELAARVAGGLR